MLASSLYTLSCEALLPYKPVRKLFFKETSVTKETARKTGKRIMHGPQTVAVTFTGP